MNIAALLHPYIESLSAEQIERISAYLDLLLRWNAKMNLTAVRDAEQIITRHFGESFCLARKLVEVGAFETADRSRQTPPVVMDIGSGAGFPGIPIKIAYPEIALTLVEAHQRKAVFLKEVLRAVHLDAQVNNRRAEDLLRDHSNSADVVTMRAVEKFENILPVAAQFVRKGGYLGILIGSDQTSIVQELLKTWHFAPLQPIPGAKTRVILLANQPS